MHLERFLAGIEPLRILGFVIVPLLLVGKRIKFIAEGMKFISEYSMIFDLKNTNIHFIFLKIKVVEMSLFGHTNIN